MIIYLDLVIISTIVVDYAILRTIALILKIQIKWYKFFLSILISIINIFLFIFPLKHFVILRYFSGFLIIFFAFPNKSLQTYIIETVMYYLLNICFIGTIIIFKIQSLKMLIVALLFVIFSKIVESYKKYIINENQLLLKVKIDKRIFSGFLDTGNMTYYKGIPLVFINTKYSKKLNFKKVGNLFIETIAESKYIVVYSGPPLKIKYTSLIVYYAFMDKIQYDLILHRDCL